MAPLTFFLLGSLSFFTSFLTAAIGIGGGTLLLAAMAQTLPVPSVIPVHGVVQFGSNLGRALLMLRQVQLQIWLAFLLGSLFGALLGGQLVVSLPAKVLKISLAVFILYSAWAPAIALPFRNIKSIAVGGAVTTLLTMFVGATGPFVMSMMKSLGLLPVSRVATVAACLVVQHGLKILVFGLLGFAFAPWIGLILVMIAMGFAGTWCGRRWLLKVSTEKFERILSLVLSLLAARLIWTAWA